MISFSASDHSSTDSYKKNHNISAKTNVTCNEIELIFVTC